MTSSGAEDAGTKSLSRVGVDIGLRTAHLSAIVEKADGLPVSPSLAALETVDSEPTKDVDAYAF